jgi:hypothetical protein
MLSTPLPARHPKAAGRSISWHTRSVLIDADMGQFARASQATPVYQPESRNQSVRGSETAVVERRAAHPSGYGAPKRWPSDRSNWLYGKSDGVYLATVSRRFTAPGDSIDGLEGSADKGQPWLHSGD